MPTAVGAADSRLPGRRRVARRDDELAAPHRPPHEPCGHPLERRLLGVLAAAPARAPRRLRRPPRGTRRDRRTEPGRVVRPGARRPVAGPRLGDRYARLSGPRPARRPPAGTSSGRCGRHARNGRRARPLQARPPRRRLLRAVRADSLAPFPDGVGFTSIYSRTDGIVDWRACLDQAAELVEVEASHVGMALNAAVYRAVAAALARFRVNGRRSAPAPAKTRVCAA